MYIKIKYTNQITLNDGEIHLNMCKNHLFYVIFCFYDLDLEQVSYNIMSYLRTLFQSATYFLVCKSNMSLQQMFMRSEIHPYTNLLFVTVH